MKPGELPHRVTLEYDAGSPPASDPAVTDDLGVPVSDWQAVAEVWARVTPTGGRELVQDGGVQSQDDYEVKLRWRDGLHSGMRFRLADGTILAINAITNPDGRQVWLTAACKRQG